MKVVLVVVNASANAGDVRNTCSIPGLRRSPGGVVNASTNAEDVRNTCSVPGLRRSPGGGHGNPLQYSCLENPMDRGAWQAV